MRIAIFGYGNLGRGVEASAARNADIELVGVFTRRDPSTVKVQTPGLPVYHADELAKLADSIDVLILCGGSATDLPVQTPAMAKTFCVVDSFDTHARIPEHFAAVDAAAKESGHLALISAGWDPGLFSLQRVYAEAVLPQGESYTFWGRGVSQGHSDAIRRIEGVEDARQYTVPVPEALARVRAGENPVLTTREKHTRECYVVAKEGADRDRITREIVEMPNYFADYDTTVHFITREELRRDHSGLPHGGSVIRSGETGMAGSTHRAVIEYRLDLGSNPEFTAGMLVACARAVHRMHAEGKTGCISLLDVPPAMLLPRTGDDLRAHTL